MNEYHKSTGNQLPTPFSGASNRPSNRSENPMPESRTVGEISENKGGDSIPSQGIPSHTARPAPSNCDITRLSRKQLLEIETRLSARDHAVLQAIRKYRFLTSDQIGRLYVTDCSTKASQTRNQNLLLKRLSDHGLIRPLARRVGGSGGGSSVQVWSLTAAGYRLLTLNDPGEHARKRFAEPSALFLRHILAVAECAVQLTDICRGSEDLTLEAIETEPACWRRFPDSGNVCFLKPDLFAITTYEDYEDRWFIEMDLGTEPVSQVVEKCNAYLRYYYSGVEQRDTGMFPLVAWIVPDEARKERIRESLREHFKAQPKMFLVITPGELERMIRQFIDQKELC